MTQIAHKSVPDAPAADVPPMQPDPEIVGHLEGNKREAERYRANIRRELERQRRGEP